jgi:hypothetical protein
LTAEPFEPSWSVWLSLLLELPPVDAARATPVEGTAIDRAAATRTVRVLRRLRRDGMKIGTSLFLAPTG